MKLARAIISACVLLAGCDTRGVSLGTEELCVKDARLESAEQRAEVEPVSNCALIGENQLQNAGFEVPMVACGENVPFCQFDAPNVAGWSTSSSELVIELWLNGHREIPAPEGSQFVELNARSRDTLWQELTLPPGQLMYWSLVHRGREGIDSMELQIGPPDELAIQATISSPEDDWYFQSGFYRVGDDEPLTRLALVSRNGGAEGNLVDSGFFAPVN